MKTKGFTLVELLVVIAILAILATVSVVGYTQYITNANETALETDAENLESIIEAELILGEQKVVIGKDASNNVIYVARKSGSVGIYYDVTNNNTVTPTLVAADTVITLTEGQYKQFSDKGYVITVTGNNTISVGSNKVATAEVITLD